MNAPALISLGYLLGSLPFAVIVSRAFGLADPRSYGSGNPGATNVLRTGNRLAAALTLLGDAAKGWLAVWLTQQAGAGQSIVALAGLAAFIGHVLPVFLKFKGGKGVATALGVLTGLSGMLALTAAATWLLVALISRYSSLAAISASLLTPLAAWLFEQEPVALCVTLICAILLWRHRQNIGKLLAGTEPRIGNKPPSPQPPPQGRG